MQARLRDSIVSSGGGDQYCNRCGAQLSPGAAFCARCGAPVAAPSTPPPSGQQGSQQQPPYDRWQSRWERRQRRQYEKQEKYEKNEKYEKGRGTRSGVIGSVIGGLILIWLGVTFYLSQAGYISGGLWWAYFLAGLGAIIMLQGLLRYASFRGSFAGSLIGGAILFLIGISFIGNYGGFLSANFWPLVLVLIGVAILASSLARGRTPPPS